MKITTKKEAILELSRQPKIMYFAYGGKTEKDLRKELEDFKNSIIENGASKVEIGKMFMDFPDGVMAIMLDKGMLDQNPYLKDIAESVLDVDSYVSPELKMHEMDEFKRMYLKSFGPGMNTDVTKVVEVPKMTGVKYELKEV